jgi:hypothetical protein
MKFPAKCENQRDKIFEKIEEDNFLKMLYLQDGRDNNYYVSFSITSAGDRGIRED